MQTFFLGLKYFFIDLVGGVLRWPFWWYTRGLAYVAKGAWSWILMYSKSLSLSVWMKNLFVPMYGMYDWQSRIISFFVRVFQIIFRAIFVLILCVAVLFGILIYILILPATAIALVYQILEIYVR